MKIMQQHPNQPPEKKLRTTGNYANGDTTNFDYQVNSNEILILQNFLLFFFLEKYLSTAILILFNVDIQIIFICI